MVRAAKRAYNEFPTVVNMIEQSKNVYGNNLEEYAKMDILLQSAQKNIGGSSDTAQLALSYYWDELNKSKDADSLKMYYDIFVILAVGAQIAIDSCKAIYEISIGDEIKRIRSLDKMKREKDYPKFMKFTKTIALMKNGKPRPYGDIAKEKKNLANRIDENIVCPMNWLEESLDTIKGGPRIKHTPIEDLFIWENGTANVYRMSRIKELVESYDNWVRGHVYQIENGDHDVLQELVSKEEEIIDQLQKSKLNYITINHLVGSALKADSHIRGAKTNKPIKASRKLLNLLYLSYHDEFMRCFVKEKF